MFTYRSIKWTSDLVISADIELSGFIPEIERLLDSIKYHYSKWTNQVNPDNVYPVEYLDEICMRVTDGYGYNGDYTCCLKGYAIDLISNLLRMNNSNSHVISFGGDIYGFNAPITKVKIYGSKFSIMVGGTFSVFTSGNTDKRGNHIICKNPNKRGFNTVIKIWDKSELKDNTYIDAITTKLFAEEFPDINYDYTYLMDFDESGKLLNKTYIASPFFDENQIKIRDNMASQFVNVFRPDLSDEAMEYNKPEVHDVNLASKVVDSNVNNLNRCQYLVYPEHTKDLGTLMEIGIALVDYTPVIKYNELYDEYLVLTCTDFQSICIDPRKKYVFDCSKKDQAVALGMLSRCTDKKNIFYSVGSNPDNIMLSVNYTRVEKINGKYELYKRDENERVN